MVKSSIDADSDRLRQFLLVAAVVAVSTSICYLFCAIAENLGYVAHTANLVMVYLLGVVFIAMRTERGPAFFGALSSVLLFDLLFVEPKHGLIPSDREYLVVLVVMLLVVFLVNELALAGKRTAKQLSLRTREAETEHLRNTLLGSISHDLKTPLASIMGASSSLLSSFPASSHERTEREKELLQSIYDESEKLEQQVSNILEITRLESGQEAKDGLRLLRREWTSIEEIIGSALVLLEHRLKEVDLRLHIPKELPLIEVDPSLLGQVVLNILDNGLKQAPDGEFSIRAFQEQKKLIVEISNTGSSIGEGEEEKIFQKFYRAAGTTRGSGLGLALCRAILDLHDGRIELLSSGRDGAPVTFMFSLPVSDKQPCLEELEQL